MSLNTISKHSLNTSKFSDSTTSLGRPFQCLTAHWEKKLFLMSRINLPLSLWSTQRCLQTRVRVTTVFWSCRSRWWLVSHHSEVCLTIKRYSLFSISVVFTSTSKLLQEVTCSSIRAVVWSHQQLASCTNCLLAWKVYGRSLQKRCPH